VIQDLARDVEQAAMALGVPAEVAHTLSCHVAAQWAHLYGGSRPYMAVRTPREEMAACLRAQYDGANRDALCARYGISRATFYRLTRAEDPSSS
jgi:Mor family transcriptional regulator